MWTCSLFNINSYIKTTFKIDSSCCSRTPKGGFCNVCSADVWNCRNTLRHCQMAEREDYRRHADWMLLFAPKARWGLSIYVIWCLLWLLLYVWVVPVVWERGYYRVIQSEKSEKNWPLSIFFYFWDLSSPLDWLLMIWATFGLLEPPGGFGEPKIVRFYMGPILARRCFGSKQLVTLYFWYFGSNLGPKRPFWAKIGFAKSAFSQKLSSQILLILHQNTCWGPFFNAK